MINHDRQNGSALIIVLIAVALFAALSFTFIRSMNDSSSGKIMSEGKAKIASSEILDYAKNVSSAVSLLQLKGCSEGDLSFENTVEAGYEHTPVAQDECKVFHPDGGGVSWQSPTSGVNDGSEWVFNGNNRITGVGVSTNKNLIMILPNITEAVCLALNKSLGVSSSALADPDYWNMDLFTGSFAGGGAYISWGGYERFCVQPAGTGGGGGGVTADNYYFVYTLIAR